MTPAKRGKGNTKKQCSKDKEQSVGDPHESMTWAQRLKRVFNIDVTICSRCGGAVKIIACIEDLSVAKKILEYMDAKSKELSKAYQLPEHHRNWIYLNSMGVGILLKDEADRMADDLWFVLQVYRSNIGCKFIIYIINTVNRLV